MTYDGIPLGYIKLARKAFSSDHGDSFWREARVYSRWEAWVDVIQLAAWRPGQFVTASEVVKLERGEFVASRRYLAKRWQWTEKRVRVFVEHIVKTARVRAQRETTAGTVYLIVNYDTYQNTQRVEGPAKGPPKGQAGAQQGPKIEEVKAVTTTTARSASQSWVARLAAAWSSRVGDVSPGHVGKALKPAVEQHGEERVGRAMLAYIAQRKANNQPAKVSWFANDIVVWVERTTGPIDVVDGEMSDTLELLTRPARAS